MDLDSQPDEHAENVQRRLFELPLDSWFKTFTESASSAKWNDEAVSRVYNRLREGYFVLDKSGWIQLKKATRKGFDENKLFTVMEDAAAAVCKAALILKIANEEEMTTVYRSTPSFFTRTFAGEPTTRPDARHAVVLSVNDIPKGRPWRMECTPSHCMTKDAESKLSSDGTAACAAIWDFTSKSRIDDATAVSVVWVALPVSSSSVLRCCSLEAETGSLEECTTRIQRSCATLCFRCDD